MQTTASTYMKMSDLERRADGTVGRQAGDAPNHYATSAVVSVSDEHSATIVGYRYDTLKVAFTVLLSILTLGMLVLLLHWKATWRMSFMCRLCPLVDATVILIEESQGKYCTRKVQHTLSPPQMELITPDGGIMRPKRLTYFTYRKLKYVLADGAFAPLSSLDGPVPLQHFIDAANAEMAGMDTESAMQRMVAYGKNAIEVNLKPIVVLLFREVITPFYVFQIFSVVLWYNDEYYYYATVIVVMSTISITLDVYQIRSLEKRVRDMMHSSDVVRCVRDGQAADLSSEDLVPGDVLWLPPSGGTLQCDAVLLSGACIVNESMLTGESVPVTKTALAHPDNDEVYSNREHARHTLFCGTKLLQTRFYAGQPVRAMVIRTGYATLKGQLVRSIMYPKPIDFRFTKDLFRFVSLLAIIALIGMTYSCTVMILHGFGPAKIFLRTMDVVTIVVPPALPAAMTIGILAAQARLRRQKIFCISPTTINTCGAVSLVAFDKTGTLTEDGLDFQCALPVGPGGGGGDALAEDQFNADGDAPALRFLKRRTRLRRWRTLPYGGALAKAIACCHSLTRINGELRGDPLDMVLFEESGWLLVEAGADDGGSSANLVDEAGTSGNESERFDQLAPTVVRSPIVNGDPSSDNVTELGILRQLPFSSALQRQSVIVRDLECTGDGQTAAASRGGARDGGDPIDRSDTLIYTKGAPERVAALCTADSVPDDFPQVVAKFAQHGYRLIAVACKPLPRMGAVKLQRIARDTIECDLTFLGIVVLENRLKGATKRVLSELSAAGLRTVMATGDNVLTAASVAREAGIVFRGSSESDAGHFYLLELNKCDEVTVERIGAAAPVNPLARSSTTRSSSRPGGRRHRTTSSQSDVSELLSEGLLPSTTGVAQAHGHGEHAAATDQHEPAVMPTLPENAALVSFDAENGLGQNVVSRPQNSALAITGAAFAALVHDCSADVVDRFVSLCDVYARMSPEHKSLLVEKLQAIGHTVAMCGDGANDCGALKSAHAGISLSEAEASIASPFTSQVADISCVATVIREGRAALVTSFGVFKYMAGYSLTQFVTVLMLYYIGTNLSDFQFLYVDLFLITTFAVCFGYQDAADGLHWKAPPERIMSLPSAVSIVGNLAIVAAFQVFVFVLTAQQPWFFPFADPGDDDSYDSYQGTAVFLLTCYQYIALAVVYSKGFPHRKPLFNNKALCVSILFCLVVSLWCTLGPNEDLVYVLDMKMPPYFEYRCLILLLAIISGLLNYLFEAIVVDWILANYSDVPFGALCSSGKKEGDGALGVTSYQQLRATGASCDVASWLADVVNARNTKAALLAEHQPFGHEPARDKRAPTWPLAKEPVAQRAVAVDQSGGAGRASRQLTLNVGSAPASHTLHTGGVSPETQTSIVDATEAAAHTPVIA